MGEPRGAFVHAIADGQLCTSHRQERFPGRRFKKEIVDGQRP
jgi:hypothetical protein